MISSQSANSPSSTTKEAIETSITPSTTSEEKKDARIHLSGCTTTSGVVDMQLDQKSLSLEIAKAVEQALVSSASSSSQQPPRSPSSNSQPTTSGSQQEERDIGKKKQMSPPVQLDPADSTVGEGDGPADTKSFQSVSSTTNENGGSKTMGDDNRQKSPRPISLPSTCSLPPHCDDPSTSDTTVSTSVRVATEEATSTSTPLKEQEEEAEAEEMTEPSRQWTRPPSALGSCLPSSTGLTDPYRPQSQSSTYAEMLRDDHSSTANTSREDVSLHDSQPCSSSNVAGEDSLSSSARRKRDKMAHHPNFCGFVDKDKGQCKQRAILSFKYCIRHILLDTTAPYKQCQFKRKPKSKKDEFLLCTNAIRACKPDIYCSTHLIMKGMMQPKKKGGAKEEAGGSTTATKPMDIMEDDYQPGYSQHSSYMDTHSPYEPMRPYADSMSNSYGGESWEQMTTGGPNTPNVNPSSNYQQLHPINPTPPTYGRFEQHHSGNLVQDMPFDGAQPPWAHHAAMEPENRVANVQFASSPMMPCHQRPFNTTFSPIEPSQQEFTQQSPLAAAPPYSNQLIQPPVQHPTPIRRVSNQQQLIHPPNEARYGAAPSPDFQTKPHQSAYIQLNDQPQPKTQVQQQQSSQSISRLSKQHPQLAAKLLQPPPQPNQHDSQLTRPQSKQPATRVLPISHQQPLLHNQPGNYRRNHSQDGLSEGDGTALMKTTCYLPQQQLVAPNDYQQSILVPIQNLPPSTQFHYIDIMPAASSPLAFLNSEPPPVKYNTEALEEESDSVDEEWKIRRDYLADDQARRRTHKSIKLRQKRQKVKIPGAFRAIPLVDSMCKVVENHDFDSTDLFPLGLEPSDDERSSDDSFPSFGNETYYSPLSPPSNRIELYLLKKQLRLESSRLVQRAKLSVPIIQASKHFKTCVGASLRARQMNRRREALTGVEVPRLRRCLHINQEGGDGRKRPVACANPCLPMSNHCAEHVLYNLNQKLFSYCSRRCCGRPVLCSDATLFEGLCRHHFEESEVADKMIAEGTTTGTNYHPKPKGVVKKQPSLTTLTTMQPMGRFGAQEAGQRHVYHQPRENGAYYNDHPSSDQLTDVDVVEGDVSLASVAKDLDLGFDGRELTDMLERLPVEESLDNDIDDNDTFMGDTQPEDDVSGMALGHSWADVEQFLLSEGYHGDSPMQPVSSILSIPAAELPISGAMSGYETLIYHEMR